jgi:pyruvate kinase
MKRLPSSFARTKIVSTLGPACSDVRTITALIRAGMDVARLNFSHGTTREHRQTLVMLRRAAHALGVPVSVILDLQGPKIRIGALTTPSVHLVRGKAIAITTANAKDLFRAAW